MTKPKKIRKYRGRKTGYGHKKKHRGGGSRGGRGRAGLHKHKWSWTTKYEPEHFGKPSLKPKEKKIKVINLDRINLLAQDLKGKELDLSEYKILGTGKLTKPINIKAMSFSKKAKEKIENVGGSAITETS